MIGRYMESLNARDSAYSPLKEPEYAKVTLYTSIIYVLNTLLISVGVYGIFYTYYPGMVQVFNPFDDSTV